MLQKFFATAIGMAVISAGYSQDSTKSSSFKLSGSADVYYRYNFNDPKTSPYNSLTSFTGTKMASKEMIPNTINGIALVFVIT